MPNKKKETTGLLVAVAPVTMEEKEKKYGGGLLDSDRKRYADGTIPDEIRNKLDLQNEFDSDLGTYINKQVKRLQEPEYNEIPAWYNIFDAPIRKQNTTPYKASIANFFKNMSNRAARDDVNFVKNVDQLDELIQERIEETREQKQEGGVIEDMAMSMPQEEMGMPMPQEEMTMAPDEQMEDNYLDFVVSESLNENEQQYLMEALTADSNLSIIFDKLMNTAIEFAGSGPVEGPGSAVSDSIPARLSDGEFVLTAKATDEIGPDNLQAMMKEAEARSEQRQMAQEGGVIREDLEDDEDDDIKKGMMGVNPRLQTG